MPIFLTRLTAQPTSINKANNRTQAPAQIMTCDQGQANAPSSEISDLDELAGDWGVYCEGSPTWVKENVSTPSVDGQSLRCSITGGTSYSNTHCYRNLLPEPASAVFTLTLSFWFTPTTTFNNQGSPSTIQGLEFTMNKWQQSKRYEFALQWQNVGASAPQWRYWDPHQIDPWVSLGITSTLPGKAWHSLTLAGDIVNDQVHYQSFTIDQQRYALNLTLPPVSTPGETDRLAVAIQLDGNYAEDPFDVFIDQVQFIRASKVYLPLIRK